MPHRVHAARPAGFTLVELLVVIGIIAALIGILMPTLGAARKAANATRCAANLRQIGGAMRLYSEAYGGALQTTNPPVGVIAPAVGAGGNWIETWQPPGLANAPRLADPVRSKTAYWGTAYLPFIASKSVAEAEGPMADRILDVAGGIWFCPSSSGMSLQYGVEPTCPISYGLNGFLTGTSGTWTNGKPVPYRKLSSYRVPSEVIVAHDAIVTLIVANIYSSSNTLSSWTASQPCNIRNWRPPNGPAILAGLSADGTGEFYRHSRKSQVLWLDGHVSAIAESLGFDVPQRWYTGKW